MAHVHPLAHAHNRSHDLQGANLGKAFGLGVALNLAYVAIEAGYGLYAGSLALVSDAGHNLSDVFGLLLAWGGHALARVPPSPRRTYGWRGTTILAALFNALLLLAATGAIAWEAVRRFRAPPELAGLPIIAVAAVGVVVNLATALLFVRHREHDLNVRGAFLHMAADAAVSLGVVLAGLGIAWFGWTWLDPLASLAIAAVIFASTWDLLKESLNLALQAVPAGIDPAAIERYLAAADGVAEVHDLHVWAMSTTEVALTAHLIRPQVADDDALLHRLQHDLQDKFGVGHVTIQIERGTGPACAQSPVESL
jgi:cobalt-zinc-cadmium efflux system protein